MDTDYVLGLLLEKGQFDIAKKYAGIVESTASQVTIKEVSWSELIVLDVDSYFALLGLFLGGAQLA